ncbi:hypothetical protein AB0J20_14115 [Micromonospora costi]|uniref:hypothetical protein n=1 Tax=Micromonospora costi TaxID=1530042 RepID=UPI0033D76FF9
MFAGREPIGRGRPGREPAGRVPAQRRRGRLRYGGSLPPVCGAVSSVDMISPLPARVRAVAVLNEDGRSDVAAAAAPTAPAPPAEE